jgi:hypothetical protein
MKYMLPTPGISDRMLKAVKNASRGGAPSGEREQVLPSYCTLPETS